MNSIDEMQMTPRMISLLRARSLIYRRTKNYQAAALTMSLLFPIASLIATMYCLRWKPLIAFTALTFSFLEVILFDRWYRVRLKTAAKLQEDFDCVVLQMDWNSFLAGSKIDPEDVFTDGNKTLSKRDEERLLNWYPIAIKPLPIHLARLVCQRTNLWYDSALRKRYRVYLLSGTIFFLVMAGWASLVNDLTLSNFVLATLAPMAPAILWAMRENNRQVATCEALDRLNEEIKKLWDSARKGETAEKLSMRSRELQDAIFNHRVSSPLIFDWVYTCLRNQMEDRMNAGADHWARELGTINIKN